MPRLARVVLAWVATSSVALAQGRPTRFWNLTQDTISRILSGARGHSPLRSQSMKDRGERGDFLHLSLIQSAPIDYRHVSGTRCVMQVLAAIALAP